MRNGPKRGAEAASAVPKTPKKRGRPRAYDPDLALTRAMDVFWKDGFAGTSLDELSAATGMNRPSLYGAFGDKRELYIKAYQHYRDRSRAGTVELLALGLPLRQLLQRLFELALDIYFSGEQGPRGCFTVLTAASDAVFDPEIRTMVQSAVREMDRAFASVFKAAQAKGELAGNADAEALARLLTATIHTVAVRARARVPRKELEALAQGFIDLVCPPAPAAR
jgi:TetR/AcrR family transcriptional regulator, copper-responsive repressor